jgi:glutaredoxin 3
MTNTIVWSKDNCPYCVQAKKMLEASGLAYEERNISGGLWTKAQLLEAVPTAKTVPQIYVHGEYVGGYDGLQQYYEDHNMFNGNQGI